MLREPSGSHIVVWAVDPFEGKIRPHPFEVRNLMTWIGAMKAQIQPVYILNLPPSDQVCNSASEMALLQTTNMEKATKNYLHEIGCKSALEPKVLFTHDAPVGSSVEKLVQYADEIGAETIIVSSRGRKGVDRFIFGSFAETLLLQSDKPLYFLTHQNGTPKEERENRILFPTDFSSHSQRVFEKFLRQAKRSGAEIVLYHGLPAESAQEIVDTANKEGSKWIRRAQGLNVGAAFFLQELEPSAVMASAIIAAAQKVSARLIAMSSSSGRTASILFGSVANDVFRTNLFPVWICGPGTQNHL